MLDRAQGYSAGRGLGRFDHQWHQGKPRHGPCLQRRCQRVHSHRARGRARRANGNSSHPVPYRRRDAGGWIGVPPRNGALARRDVASAGGSSTSASGNPLVHSAATAETRSARSTLHAPSRGGCSDSSCRSPLAKSRGRGGTTDASRAAPSSSTAVTTVKDYVDLFDPRRYGTNWLLVAAYAIAGLLTSLMSGAWGLVTGFLGFDTLANYAQRTAVLTVIGTILVWLLHRARPAALVVLSYALSVAALRAGLVFNSIESETVRQHYMENLPVFITQWLAYPALESLALIIAIRRTEGTVRGLIVAFSVAQILPVIVLPMLGDAFSYDRILENLGFAVIDGVLLGGAFSIAINRHLRKRGFAFTSGRILAVHRDQPPPKLSIQRYANGFAIAVTSLPIQRAADLAPCSTSPTKTLLLFESQFRGIRARLRPLHSLDVLVVLRNHPRHRGHQVAAVEVRPASPPARCARRRAPATRATG